MNTCEKISLVCYNFFHLHLDLFIIVGFIYNPTILAKNPSMQIAVPIPFEFFNLVFIIPATSIWIWHMENLSMKVFFGVHFTITVFLTMMQVIGILVCSEGIFNAQEKLFISFNIATFITGFIIMMLLILTISCLLQLIMKLSSCVKRRRYHPIS